jgi:hypothetical protein
MQTETAVRSFPEKIIEKLIHPFLQGSDFAERLPLCKRVHYKFTSTGRLPIFSLLK